jgi:small-conductance mechanosensitive channel
MHMRWCRRYGCVWVIIGVVLLGRPTWGQVNLPQQPSSVMVPSNVTRYGSIETTDVVFDGKKLFTIASPTVWNRNNPGDLIPVEMRAEFVAANLRRIVAPYVQNLLDSREPQVIISVATINRETVLLGRTEFQQQNIVILTVTELDSSYHGIPIAELARQWQQMIQKHLQKAISERTPKALIRQIFQAMKVLALTLIISVLVLGLQRLLYRRRIHIQKRIEALKEAQSDHQTIPQHIPGASPPPSQPHSRNRHELIRHITSHFSYHQSYKVIAFFSYLLLWLQVAIWLAGMAHTLFIFPQTRGVAPKILDLPILWLMVWFLTGLGDKIGDFLIDRLRQAWEYYDLFHLGDITRKSLRISTTITTLRGVKTATVYTVRAGYILSTLGVPVSSIFALGGLLALAISLGSQNVIKDVINGLLILWEDQFGIGDVVQIGEHSGVVESMSLRITQLRNSEGCLITIPNSSIVKVSNFTRLWSRVNFEILVDCQTDPTQALEVLKQVTQAFYADPDWQPYLISSPEVLGIDAASHEGLLLRVWLKTQPGQQWSVSREFRRRVVQGLMQAGIALGRPHQVWEGSDRK